MKKLEDALDIEVTPVPKGTTPRENATEIVVSDDTDSRKKELEKRTDYAEVRSNLKDIINNGMSAIDGILQVANEGDSPRAYEVVSQLIKSVTEANKDLMGLHQQMKELNRETPESSRRASSITNNSIFVGSTKDLQRLVKDNFKQLKEPSNGDT